MVAAITVTVSELMRSDKAMVRIGDVEVTTLNAASFAADFAMVQCEIIRRRVPFWGGGQEGPVHNITTW